MNKFDQYLYEQEDLFRRAQDNTVQQHYIARKLSKDLKTQRGIALFLAITMWFIIAVITIFSIASLISWGLIALLVCIPIIVIMMPLAIVGLTFALPKIRQRQERMRLMLQYMENYLQRNENGHV